MGSVLRVARDISEGDVAVMGHYDKPFKISELSKTDDLVTAKLTDLYDDRGYYIKLLPTDLLAIQFGYLVTKFVESKSVLDEQEKRRLRIEAYNAYFKLPFYKRWTTKKPSLY